MGITVNSKSFSVFGDKAAVVADLSFSGDYAYGGLSLDHDQLFGVHDVAIALIEPQAGYSFKHDATNKKIKVYGSAPPIVYEEKQTPSSDIVTTNYPAAFIMGICRSGANKKLRSTGIAVASLSDDQCSLVSVMAAGTRTQITVKDYDRLAGQGAFTSAATGWTFSDSKNDWTEADDALNKDADGVETITHSTFTPTIGRTYRLTYAISNWTVGTVTPSMGGVTGTAAGADGTVTEDFTAVNTTGLVFTPTNTSRFTLDSVTVYDITEPVYVTYVTQAWKDVWDNLVQDEAITLATGDNTIGELISTAANRDMSGESSWTNVDVNAYDESDDITVTANAAGQYFTLGIAYAPTVPGTAYRFTLDVANIADTWEVYDFTGTQLIATISADGTKQTFNFTAETYGGFRFVAVAATSSADFDNFSLSVGNEILACMYVDQTEATAVGLTMIDEDDTAATGEVSVRFGTPLNQLSVAAAQNGKDAKITYIKKPSSGFLYERAFNDETASKAGIDPYVNVFDHPILIWGTAGELPVNGGTTQVMIDSMSTPGAGEFSIDWSQKPRVAANPPALVVEEVVTCASNVGTLAYLPLYIVAIQVTATTTTGSYVVIPVGETPLTKQCAVNFATGGLTFLSTDAVTSVKVTYIPKRASGYLSTVTVDETATASASKVNLAARAGLIQYVWDDTDGKIVQLEQPGTAPSATNFCTIDIVDTTNSSIDSHADDAGNTLKVTYVPYTQLPPGTQIDDTDIMLSSEVWNFTGDPTVLGYNNLVVPGFGVHVIGETGAAARAAAVWIGPTGTAGAGVSLWNPATNSITTDNDTAITILSMPWMILDLAQLTPYAALSGQAVDVKSNVTGSGAGVWGDISEVFTVPLEIPATSVSGLTSVKMLLIGT